MYVFLHNDIAVRHRHVMGHDIKQEGFESPTTLIYNLRWLNDRYQNSVTE